MSIPKALNITPFAEYTEMIQMLYQTDDDFKTLCDDYSTAQTNMEKFKDKFFEDKKQELEYKKISVDLETEILDYLKKLRWMPFTIWFDYDIF